MAVRSGRSWPDPDFLASVLARVQMMLAGRLHGCFIRFRVTRPIRPQLSSKVGFVGLDGRQVRMRLAEGVPVRFEAVAPVRAFPSFKRQRYFPGLWWSATTRRHLGYESWLERDHLMLLDHDPAVVLPEQPE